MASGVFGIVGIESFRKSGSGSLSGSKKMVPGQQKSARNKRIVRQKMPLPYMIAPIYTDSKIARMLSKLGGRGYCVRSMPPLLYHLFDTDTDTDGYYYIDVKSGVDSPLAFVNSSIGQDTLRDY